MQYSRRCEPGQGGLGCLGMGMSLLHGAFHKVWVLLALLMENVWQGPFFVDKLETSDHL